MPPPGSASHLTLTHVSAMHPTVWSQLDQGSIVSTGLPLSALFHSTPSPPRATTVLPCEAPHTSPLLTTPTNQPPRPLAQNSNCAVLHRTLWEEPFICPHSLPQHWPDFCPSTTPSWLPSQGLCNCFLRLRTFLPGSFASIVAQHPSPPQRSPTLIIPDAALPRFPPHLPWFIISIVLISTEICISRFFVCQFSISPPERCRSRGAGALPCSLNTTAEAVPNIALDMLTMANHPIPPQVDTALAFPCSSE